nr:methyl-accepting chemotaxis protein [uncultured Noviherbaspirillum sp.]
MLKNFTIKLRLVFVVGFLCLISIVIGIQGLVNQGATNASVKTLYEDRVVALGQLKKILSQIQQNQITIATALHGDPQQFIAATDEVTNRIATVSATWKDYMATYLTPEEKKLAERFAESRKMFVEGGLQPALAAMRANEADRAKSLLRGPLTSLFKPVEKHMEDLIQLQMDVSKAEFEQSQARYSSSRTIAIVAIALGLLVGISMAYSMISSIMRSLAEALKLAKSVAEGDLTQRVDIRSNDELGQLLHALGTMNTKLVDIVTQVRYGTDTIATASSQIAAGNMDLSSRTEQQASSLEETASSMEELTSTVKQNADNARQANQLAIAASTIAAKGGTVVAEVVNTMDSINDSARKIVDIISVIDGIAFQTNILALNAAVEAARAGEQGRGFAVVASEVRSLAQRSAAAAKEIKTLIDDSVDKVDTGSQLVAQAGSTMDEVVESVRRVTDIMAEISAASNEQSAGIEQVNQAVSQMDQVTQQNAALVEEAAAAAGSLQEQSGQLAKMVSVFKIDNHNGRGIEKTTVPMATLERKNKQTRVRPSTETHAVSTTNDLAHYRSTKPVQTISADGWEEF